MIPYYQSVAARSDDTEFVKKIWDALNSLEKIGALRDTIDFKIETDLFVYYRDWETDRKSTRLNSSHSAKSRMPSSA